MKKPRIGLDVDGVLLDILTPCFKTLAELYEIELDPRDLRQWDFDHLIPEGRHGEFWVAMGRPGVCRSLQPYPGAVEGVRRLAEVADLFVVTSHLHTPTWVHEREECLAEHFGFQRGQFVHCRDKRVFYGDALVDDKPQNVAEWAAEHPRGVPVLWLQNYNRYHAFEPGLDERVWRTDDWGRVLGLANLLAQSQ